jgi:hypothetical protein
VSSFLERLKARMSGSLAKPMFDFTKKEKTRHTLVTNRWDEKVWDTARPTKPVNGLIHDLLQGEIGVTDGRPPFDAGAELVHDLFMAFYKANPTLVERRNIEKDVYPAYKIIKEILDNDKLRDLQEMTAGDPVMSTIALEAMAGNVKEIIARIPPPPPPPMPRPRPEPKPKHKKPNGEDEEGGGEPTDQPGQGQGQPQGEGQGEGNNEGQGQGQGQGPGGGEQESGEGDGSEQDEDLSEDADTDEFDPESENDKLDDEWKDQFDDLLDDLDLDRAANKALDAADQEASDLENLRKGIGLEDGEWQSMDPSERFKMAERLQTPHMKELSDIIGRMRRFALGIKASRITDVPHEAFDVETGNDMKRVLKAEFALLSTPETTYEFYRKYFEKELLQFKMRGHEEVGKGPIVMAIDKSGSMNGKPFMWAMAVAEALRRFAAEEDRDIHVIFFGNNNDRTRFYFPKGKAPFEKILEFLSCVANGGTQFDGVLTEALKRATESFDGEGKGKADILFLTDGMAHLDDTWIEDFNRERERVGVRVYSVFIGGAYDYHYGDGGRGPLGLLKKISDVAFPVKDLTPDSVQTVFERV